MQAIVESTCTSIADAEIRDLIDSFFQTPQEKDAADLVAPCAHPAVISDPSSNARQHRISEFLKNRNLKINFDLQLQMAQFSEIK